MPDLSDAFASITPHLKTKGVKLPDSLPPDTGYANPAAWRLTRSLLLIHQDSDTVLGIFDEFLHRTDPSARRLLLATGPREVGGREYVSGSWWVAERHSIPPAAEHYTRTVEVALDLRLDTLSVWSPSVILNVSLATGAMTRADLADETQFAQLPSTPDQLLSLPAGVNVLGLMGRDAKIALWAQVQGELG